MVGYRSIQGSASEFKPPAPSKGVWDHEDDFGPDDERPNEPTIFMPNAKTVANDDNQPPFSLQGDLYARP
jgi:hypothetical protein